MCTGYSFEVGRAVRRFAEGEREDPQPLGGGALGRAPLDHLSGSHLEEVLHGGVGDGGGLLGRDAAENVEEARHEARLREKERERGGEREKGENIN